MEWCDDTPACSERTVTLSARGRQPRVFDAVDVRFVDEDRALVLAETDAGRVLRIEYLDGAPSDWQTRVPALQLGTIAIGDAGAWTVTGADAGGKVRVSGTIGAGAPVTRRWSDGDEHEGEVEWYAGDGGAALRVATTYDDGAWRRFRLRALFSLPHDSYGARTTLLHDSGGSLGALTTTTLPTRCVDAAGGATAAWCTAFDGSRTHLWSFDPTAGLTPIGTMDGTYELGGAVVGSRAVMQHGCRWRIVDAAARDYVDLDAFAAVCPVSVELNGNIVAFIDEGPVARVFRVSVER
jgi:hypothetical protein